MKIYFARHGETDWNVIGRIQGTTDIPLNEKGREQAVMLADNLMAQNINLGRIYCSKLIRAKETAEAVGKAFDVDVRVAKGIEEMQLGKWEGMTWKEIEVEYPRECAEFHSANRRYAHAPEGENYQELMERAVAALESIVADAQDVAKEGKDILVISHGATILSLITLKEDIPFDLMLAKTKVENAKAFEFDESDVAALRSKL